MEISVVLVTYNRPVEILTRAYNSVIYQTYKPKEFVIVNAGTSNIPIFDKCKMVDVPGANGSKARNVGASHTTAEFIAFLDDDDEWTPDHLHSHISCINKDTGLIYSYDPNKSIWDRNEKEIMIRNWIGPTSFVSISKKYFEQAGKFDESFSSNQEWDLWIRMSKICSVTECPMATVIKHDSPDSISSDIAKRLSGWISILTKYENDYRNSPEIFVKVTKVFKDEMYLRHSIKGIISAWKWCKLAHSKNARS